MESKINEKQREVEEEEMLKDALSTIPDSDDDEGREEIIIKSKKQKKGNKK